MSTEFTKDQYALAYPDGIERHYWHLARNRIVAKEIMRLSAKNARVLDIGAGRGIAVKYLRDSGIDCFGVEPARAKPLAGVEPFIRYGIDAAGLSGDERSGYQIILLLDLIEHLEDPDSFMKGLLNLFPSCESFIITVPACPELWSNYDEFYGHHRRYTMAMIDELAAKTRLKVAHAGFFFRLFYLPARLLSALGIKRSCTVNPPGGIGLVINEILTAISLIEYSVLPRSLRGTSILASFIRQ